MKIILVRRVQSHEILGLFWGNEDAYLWDLVDHIDDPYSYEYCILQSGALCFEGAYEPKFPKPFTEEDDYEDHTAGLFDKANLLGDTHLDAVLNGDSSKWKRFDPSSKGVGLVARIKADAEARKNAS